MNSMFAISSDAAYVAMGVATCWRCGKKLSVVCVHCVRGEIGGEPYEHFTVFNLVRADAALVEALGEFPLYRVGYSRTAGMRYFANHCDRCGSLQGDFYLHEEVDSPFFPTTSEEFARISFTRIDAAIRCDGDACFGPMTEAFVAWVERLRSSHAER